MRSVYGNSNSTAAFLSKWKVYLERLVKFGLVGASGVVINSATLFILHSQLGLPLLLAAPLAFEFAVVNNYFWNDAWTFGTRSPSLRRLVKFNLISLGALFISVSILHTLVEWANWHYLIANLIGITFSVTWNFFLNILWTWRDSVACVRSTAIGMMSAEQS